MAEYLKPAKYAKLLGISRQAVYQAIDKGILHKGVKGIDPEHPTNLQYKALLEAKKTVNLRSLELNTPGRKQLLEQAERSKNEKVNGQGEKEEETPIKPPNKAAPAKETRYKKEESFTVDENNDLTNAIGTLVDQKKLEEIRVKRITADLKSLEYTQKLGALIDMDSLTKLFFPFYNFLLTELIHMPEEISDLLYMVASNSDDPKKAIQDELKNRIESIVIKAKEVVKDIIPTDGYNKKIVIVEEDDD